MIVGDVILKDIIKDFCAGRNNIVENYKDTGAGFSFSIYELIVVIFAGIQALDAMLNFIEKLKLYYKNEEIKRNELEEKIYKSLLDNGITEEAAQRYCEEVFSHEND